MEEERGSEVMESDERRAGKKRKQPQSPEPEPGPPPKRAACTPKRKPFSRADEELIANFFRQHISRRQFPTIAESREFLELYPMDRTPKDIYDKCRNIAGRP